MENYSVALCTYNGSKYVIEQLKSIINQSIKPTQIVVSDDGSTDGTVDIVKEYLSDKGIDHIVTLNNSGKGVSNNFMNALKLCSEEIIFTSDQDDYWMPHKAEIILKVFNDNPKSLLVFSNGELTDDKLNPLGHDIWSTIGISENKCTEGRWNEYLLNKCLITGAAMSLRKSLLQDIPEIPQEWLHDGYLAWAAVIKNGLTPCNEKLIKYRQHESNVVGLRPKNLIRRLLEWRGIDKKQILNNRKIKYHRYLHVQEKWGNQMNEYQRRELDNCVSFWKELHNLKSHNAVKRAGIVLNLYFKGYYKKYYNGNKSFIRDLIISL